MGNGQHHRDSECRSLDKLDGGIIGSVGESIG